MDWTPKLQRLKSTPKGKGQLKLSSKSWAMWLKAGKGNDSFIKDCHIKGNFFFCQKIYVIAFRALVKKGSHSLSMQPLYFIMSIFSNVTLHLCTTSYFLKYNFLCYLVSLLICGEQSYSLSEAVLKLRGSLMSVVKNGAS